MAEGRGRRRNADHSYSPNRKSFRSNDDDEISINELNEELNRGMASLNLSDINLIGQKCEESKILIEQKVTKTKDTQDIVQQLWKLQISGKALAAKDSNENGNISQLENDIISGMKKLKLKNVDFIQTCIETVNTTDLRDNKITEKLEQLRLSDAPAATDMRQHDIIELFKELHVADIDIFKPMIKEKIESFKQSKRESEEELELFTQLKNLRLINDTITSSGDYSTFRRPQSSQYKGPNSASIKFYFQSTKITRICYPKLLSYIRQRYRRLCKWHHNGFPGCHPTHLTKMNYRMLSEAPYQVTWKPMGKRYMVFIEKRNSIFMLDVGDHLFTVENIEFPSNDTNTDHLYQTLIDGEIVFAKMDGLEKPCFLINDIISYNGEQVHQKPFKERLMIIKQKVIDPRNKSIEKHYMNQSTQVFSVDIKTYFVVSKLNRLLDEQFLHNVPYQISGLYFIAEKEPYTPGTSRTTLKWTSKATIEFQLKIADVPNKEIHLFLNNETAHYATMKWNPELEFYKDKIVECSYDEDQREWHFERLREDRPYPNSVKSANAAIHAIRNNVTKQDLFQLLGIHQTMT